LNQPLSATDRLRWLLRLYRYAQVSYDPTPPSETAGNTILPGLWAQGSFQELDKWIRIMRACNCPPPRPGARTKHSPACMKATYWHLRERYIDPEERTWHGTIRLIRIAGGQHRVQGLPPNSELADPFHVAIRPPVAILQWRSNISRTQVQLGIDWLLHRMHNGHPDRISLPKDFRGAMPEPAEREKVAA
jgi:hypothetical protein